MPAWGVYAAASNTARATSARARFPSLRGLLSRPCGTYAGILAIGLLLAVGLLTLDGGCVRTDDSKTPRGKPQAGPRGSAPIDTSALRTESPAVAPAPASTPTSLPESRPTSAPAPALASVPAAAPAPKAPLLAPTSAPCTPARAYCQRHTTGAGFPSIARGQTGQDNSVIPSSSRA